MRVYKFIGPKWGIDNLKNRHVKIGEFPDLNDPFELLPFVFPDAESEEAVLSWREDEGKEHGLCRYSRTPTNPVMWAHYTENHRGLCLGLEVPDAPEGTPEKLASPDHHAYLHPVTYVDTPYIFPVSSDGLNEELICRFLYTKFDHWRYEDEFRVYTTITDRNKKGLCFVNFGVNLVESKR